MRQVGILAAAGRYAVTHHLDRIQSDHENATLIAAHLREAGIDVTTPRSNIVIVPTVDAIRTTLLCREHGVLVSPLAPNSIRLVTHLDVDATECRRAATVVAGICQ
jgi:threonine aldolase